ncbi:MAG: hypothetical protein FWE88_05795 [Phycisphaerae bacterium]|nr:hypothetical protein [Phycisphaerae bacterium]
MPSDFFQRGIYLGLLLCLTVGCQPAAPVGYSLADAPSRVESWDTPYAPGGRVLATPHYRMYVGSKRAELANTLPGFMEGAHANYCELTGLSPKKNLAPMTLYMMADRAQWVAVTKSLVTENLDLYLRIEAGGYCFRGTCVFWDIGGLSSFQVAAHEGLHQFLFFHLTDRVPMWLEEALGTAAEGFQLYNDRVVFSPHYNTGRMANLQAAIVGNRLIPLSKLLTMHAGDAVGQSRPGLAVEYYAQLWSLIMYIRGEPAWRAGMERMLADAAAGRLSEGLGQSPREWAAMRQSGAAYFRTIGELTFRRYITDDLPAFEKGLRDYQRKLAGLK